MEDKEILIWKYLDGDCSENEAQEFRELLVNSKAFALQYQRSSEIHKVLQEKEMDVPSMAFTNNVMRSITSLSSKALSFSFKKFLGVLVIIMGLVYASMQIFPNLYINSGLVDYSNVQKLQINTELVNWLPGNANVIFILLSMILLYWMDQILIKNKFTAK